VMLTPSTPPDSHPLRLLFYHKPRRTRICLLSLHDALPISAAALVLTPEVQTTPGATPRVRTTAADVPALSDRPSIAVLPFQNMRDRKSTRLNSSHRTISYAVFCLKKKNGGRYVRIVQRDLGILVGPVQSREEAVFGQRPAEPAARARVVIRASVLDTCVAGQVLEI